MRGSILQKKNESNKWYIVVDFYDSNGKRKRKWFSGYKLKKDAEKDLPRILKMMNDNQYVETNGMTVEEFFSQELEVQKNELKKGTVISYERMLRLYLKPIHKVKIQNTKAIQIQNIYNQMLSGELTGRKLSAKTVRNFNGYIHNGFKRALKLGLISHNPVEATEVPKLRKFEIKTLNKTQMDTLLEHAKDKPYYLGYLLAITTGMRKGELLGLKYEDIDFQNNTITIRRTRQMKWMDTPKNESSKRCISITEEVKNAILDNIKIQKENEKDLGNIYQKNDFVIKDFDGNIRPYDWLNECLTNDCIILNIPHIRFHDLRHSHATYLVSKGVNLKIIQDRLGHSTISTTANTYSHPNVEAQREALEGLF